ncbi:hypothetical protein [Allokutzneria oryzae]|uniref:Uncharacterized protein n=1 Tax=Allokutzneria oryzae TaxID=1378989 RepID=A0ABV6A106_9PSEU
MIRIRSAAASAALACAAVLAPAVTGLGAQAFAACPEVGQTSYAATDIAKAWLPTNLTSDYLVGPGAIGIDRKAKSRAKAALAGITPDEAKSVFGRTKRSLTVAVGVSYSRSQHWAYSAEVPAGQTRRLQHFKEARSFTVKKTTIVAPCKVKTLWTKQIVAPVMNDSFRWGLVS